MCCARRRSERYLKAQCKPSAAGAVVARAGARLGDLCQGVAVILLPAAAHWLVAGCRPRVWNSHLQGRGATANGSMCCAGDARKTLVEMLVKPSGLNLESLGQFLG